jgi:dipeptidyl aminopeptidase/acylaminoacyl peptidase
MVLLFDMPHASRWVSAACLLLVLGGLGPATAQSPSTDRSSLRASDLFKVRTIQDVTISPTGRHAAYTVRRSTPDGHTARTQLYVASLTGRDEPRLLTRTPQGATHPTWGPDGLRIAFVRPVESTPQLFVLSLDGGEPYQLTDAPHGATRPQWGPQGDHILFSSRVPESAVRSRAADGPWPQRPGRRPEDTTRPLPSDTLLVLRHAQTLDPVDTLAVGPQGRSRSGDTTRSLRAPSGPDSLRSLPTDSLRALSSDSLRSVFEALRLRPDTTTVPIRSDTAASPDGDLLQQRRWLDQSRPDAPSIHAGAAFPNEASRTYRHYFTVDVPSTVDRGTPPIPSPQPVTRGLRSFGEAQWLPGGSQVVVSGPAPHGRRDSAATHNLYVADLDRPRIHRLLSIEGYTLHSPRVTSDGTTIAFRAQAVDAPTYAQTEVGLFSLDGRSDPRLITDGFDRDVRTLRWSPDGWYLYATAPSSPGRPLYRLSPFAAPDTTAEGAGRTDAPSLEADRSASRDTFALDSTMIRTAPHERLTEATRRVRAVDVTDAVVVYAAADETSPSELYTNTVSFGNERRLSAHNAWLNDRRLASTSSLTVTHDSLSVPGRLTRPTSPIDSLGAPLAVLPRGGPPALDRPSPSRAWFERHYLAAQGLAVVEVWPRGSVGQGNAYRRANYRNWGPGPFADVQAVADSAAGRAWIDEDRRGLAGHGYGASLTVWGLAHADTYRAAVAHDGVYTLSSLLHDRATARLLPDQFGGGPWDGPSPAVLARDSVLSDTTAVPTDTTLSPRTALYRSAPLSHVDRIRTPLLLTRSPGAGPDASAPAVYARLRALNRPVEYARYNAPPSPAQNRDQVVRLYEFLARFLSASPDSASSTDE